MKILVRALMTHAHPTGTGLVRKGDEYLEHEYYVQEKVDARIVELVGSGDSGIEAFRSEDAIEETKSDAPVELVAVNAPWFTFSDGSKVMGTKKAAERLGVDDSDVQPLVDALQDEDGGA